MAYKASTSKYNAYTSSFSGTDMVVSAVFPGEAPIVMGTISTVTYSLYRQMSQVRTLGRITPRGYARGGRTYAGTLIFTVLRESFVEEIRRRISSIKAHKTISPDELPPMDLIISMGNEFGQSAALIIYGMRFIDESMTLSIEDIFTENVMTFMAENVRHMKDAKNISFQGTTLRASTEDVGKFDVNKLLANVEDKARQKKLAAIAKAEKARWKEPVLADPGTVPNFSPTESGGSSSSSSSKKYTVKVYTYVTNTSTKLGSVSVTGKIDGKKVTKKTSSKGVATFTAKKKQSVKFSASKSGYAGESKSITFGANGATDSSLKMYLTKKPKKNEGTLPATTVYDVRKYGTYAADVSYSFAKSNDSIKFKKGSAKTLPQILARNTAKKALSGVTVHWYYKIANYSDHDIKKVCEPKGIKKSGKVGNSKTNSKGVATMPYPLFGVGKLGMNNLPIGTVIVFTARTMNSKTSKVESGSNLWREFAFYDSRRTMTQKVKDYLRGLFK